MGYRCVFLFAVTCFLASGSAVTKNALANPTGTEPNRPLAAHGTIPQAKELVASLYKLCEEEEKFVIETFERMDNPVSFSDRQISKSAGRLWKARRDVQHLDLMGEPAAIDLDKRVTMLNRQVHGFGGLYRGTPKGAQLLSRIRTKLQREKPKLTRFLEQAAKALQQGKLEIFEKQMEIKGIELYEQLVYFSPTERGKYAKQFDDLLSQGDNRLASKRVAAYKEMATAAMQEEVAAALQFAAESKRIASEIAASGSATLGDEKTGDAAEALAHVVDLWGAASVGLIRAGAIQWAFTGRAQARVQPDPQQLKTQALRSLASIVEAAAASTSPDQVQPLYSKLLNQISAADRRISFQSDEVFQACQSALGKLAAQDPSLPSRIERYSRATSEALNWRRRFASQQSRNLEQLFPKATTLLAAEADVETKKRPNYAAKMLTKGAVAPSSFTTPACWMVQDAASQLIGKPVSEVGMLRLSPSIKTAVVPHDSKHFGNVAVPLSSEQEVGDLMEALVVDERYGPLTRESADAVSAAQLHDYLTVGGRIQRVHLEPAVTRFAALPDIAYTLVPLGKMPVLDEGVGTLSHTCWRLDLQPMWAQHRYFTVRPGAK